MIKLGGTDRRKLAVPDCRSRWCSTNSNQAGVLIGWLDSPGPTVHDPYRNCSSQLLGEVGDTTGVGGGGRSHREPEWVGHGLPCVWYGKQYQNQM